MNKYSLLEKIVLLPNELRDLIKSYLPISVLVFLNKKNYIYLHNLYIKHKMNDSYIRFIIRNNYWFILNNLLENYYKLWTKKNKYKYKNIIYSDYLQFITHYCIENNANDCKNIILLFIEKLGMSKNQHKNNTTINIRWKH